MVDVRPVVLAPGPGWVDPAPDPVDPVGRGVLEAAVTAAVRLTDADTSGVLLADPRGRSVRMRACAGSWTVNSANLTVRAGRGLAGRILVTRKPWKVDDYGSDTTVDCGELQQIIDADGTRSGLGVPMLDGDEVVGVLMVWSRRCGAFDSVATRALAGLAELVTAALVQSRRVDAERRARAELERRCDLLASRAEESDHVGRLRAGLTAGVIAGEPLDALLSLVCERTGGEAAVLDRRLGVLAASGPVEGLLARVVAVRPDDVAARRLLEPAGPAPARWTLLHRLPPAQERGGLLAVCLPHPPTARDEACVAETAVACALALGRERAVLEARSHAQGDLVLQLLDGTVDDAVAAARARQLGSVLPQRLRVVVVPVHVDGPAEEEPWRHRLDALVSAAGRAGAAGGPVPLVGRRGPEVVVLLGADDEDDPAVDGGPSAPAAEGPLAARSRTQALLAAMRRLAPDVVRAAGVSGCVDVTTDLSAAVRQARHALAAAALAPGTDAEGNGAAGVVLFDDLGLMRFLLAPSDRDDQQRFARAVLGTVLDYDAAHHGDLVRTLGAYLDAGCSLTRAAADLFVHPKTVRYRLRRVEELSGRDLGEQRDRFDAQVAMMILRALALDEHAPDLASRRPAQ